MALKEQSEFERIPGAHQIQEDWRPTIRMAADLLYASRGGFEISKTGAGEYRVSGDAVERLIARHDLENEEALAHVEHRLRRMGVITALEKEGFEPGDDVEIAGILFELDPGAPA